MAAECCYGAELVDGHQSGNKEDISISNNYLLNGALAFMGSSTIAYGPSDSQGLADLITQYFIKSVLEGASSGRAMLEARQKFLSVSGPSLDPYELKTLAQFYLLGDPSVQVIKHVGDQKTGSIKKGGISNNRFNLFNKGMSLKKTIAPCKKIISGSKTKYRTVIKKLLKEQNFTAKAKEQVYRIKPELYQAKLVSPTSKELVSTEAKYRTFMETKKLPGSRLQHIKVLVVKETPGEVLGWRTYVSR